MVIALLQPCFLPDLHYIASLKKASCIILQDYAIWSRKGRTHRFLIRTKNEPVWMSIPIKAEDKKKTISEVRIDRHQIKEWITKCFRTFDTEYRNSIYYDFYEAEIKDDFRKALEKDRLVEAITYMNKRIFTYLEWQPDPEAFKKGVPFISIMNPQHILDELPTETLFQEENGTQFQWRHPSAQNSLKQHPVYKQHFGKFIENACVLDLLFETGPECYKILDSI